jgi:exosortase A-associated hydrolase 2
MARADSSAQAFFLRGSAGGLYALYRTPVSGAAERAAIFLPPFAEEMNKSRRMVTLAAQALARAGVASLIVDLHGTGDSAGEFSEARWETWRTDVAAAGAWLRERGHRRVIFVGLRLGALLALDASRAFPDLDHIVLWQPVLAGDAMLTQFLRTDVAAQMLAQADTRSSTEALRKRLQSGETVEVAGYALAPALVAAIEALRLESIAFDRTPIDWLEVVPEPGRGAAPAWERVRQSWAARGLEVRHRCVVGPPFWSSVEIAVAPALVQATVDALETAG